MHFCFETALLIYIARWDEFSPFLSLAAYNFWIEENFDSKFGKILLHAARRRHQKRILDKWGAYQRARKCRKNREKMKSKKNKSFRVWRNSSPLAQFLPSPSQQAVQRETTKKKNEEEAEEGGARKKERRKEEKKERKKERERDASWVVSPTCHCRSSCLDQEKGTWPCDLPPQGTQGQIRIWLGSNRLDVVYDSLGEHILAHQTVRVRLGTSWYTICELKYFCPGLPIGVIPERVTLLAL